MFQRNKFVFALITIAVSFLIFNTSTLFAHSDHDGGHGHCKHCEEKIAKMDTDNDGKISRREFMQYHGQLFDKRDLNNDRFLDMDEIHWMMEDMHEKMRAKHGHGKDHKMCGHDSDGGHGNDGGHDSEEHSHEHEDDQEENHDHDDSGDHDGDDEDDDEGDDD